MWGSSDQSGADISGWWRHRLPAPLGWEISSCPRCSLEHSGYDSRESCVLQMMTSGIKAPRGAILSPEQAVVGRATCMLAFWRASSRQRNPSSCRHMNMKLSQSWKPHQFHGLAEHFKFNIVSKVGLIWSSQVSNLSFSSKYIGAHFVEILLRTAVHHALWVCKLIMQIYSTLSRFPP